MMALLCIFLIGLIGAVFGAIIMLVAGNRFMVPPRRRKPAIIKYSFTWYEKKGIWHFPRSYTVEAKSLDEAKRIFQDECPKAREPLIIWFE